MELFPTIFHVLFYLEIVCLGESFSSLVFLTSVLLNSPIALVCNSAVAGPQPGWERRRETHPEHTGKSQKVCFSTWMELFPTIFHVLFYLEIVCLGESFSSLVFLTSVLLNSSIAFVCNSAVAGPQPGWERRRETHPEHTGKVSKCLFFNVNGVFSDNFPCIILS